MARKTVGSARPARAGVAHWSRKRFRHRGRWCDWSDALARALLESDGTARYDSAARGPLRDRREARVTREPQVASPQGAVVRRERRLLDGRALGERRDREA